MNFIPTNHFKKRFKKRFPHHDMWRELDEAVNNTVAVPPSVYISLKRKRKSDYLFICNDKKILFILKGDLLITCYSLDKKSSLYKTFDNL